MLCNRTGLFCRKGELCLKRLLIINGTMGVGKTAVCGELARLLPKNVFLDGDWCWNMRPFVVTEETKRMVMENISFLLNRFLSCSAYENVIFCWVLHEQPILDELLSRLALDGVEVHAVSLVCSELELRRRLGRDIAAGLRTADVVERSVPRLALYAALNTKKLDVSELTAEQAAKTLLAVLKEESDAAGLS